MIKKLQSDVAALKREVAKLGNIRIAGRSRTESRGGIAFGGEPGLGQSSYVPPKDVVIVAQPVAADTVLGVREVAYRGSLPGPCVTGGDPPVTACDYIWKNDSFVVYPAFGMKPIDYLGDELQIGGSAVPGNETNLPQYDSTFHRCTWQHGYWMLAGAPKSSGGGGMEPVRALAAVPGARTISVQPVKRIKPAPSNPMSPAWMDNGPSIPAMALWGEERGEDFTTLLGNIIPAVQFEGEWYAVQYLWFATANPNEAIQRGDCQ